MGAYIKRYVEVEKYKTEKMILAYLSCVVLTWASKYLLNIFIRASIISANKESMLVNYTSPTIFVAAVALLILFSKVKVRKARKIVDFFAPLTFGVYLMHGNPDLRNNASESDMQENR